MKNLNFFYIVLILAFLVLFSRLFWLQIIKGSHYQSIAQENRIRMEKMPAPRGVIFDKNGKLLVNNTPEGREYLYGKSLAHILGFLGEADEGQVESREYQLGDLVGREGVEKIYDKTLRGQDGGRILEVGAEGEETRELGQVEAVAGENIKLELDLELQEAGFRAMKGRRGALVASGPDGKILALVSSPAFDPHKVEEVLVDQDQPLFNRAIAGLYPPGSTFKIITAVAGLEERRINKDTTIEDTGEIKIGKWRFGNWYYDKYGKKEGIIGLVRAIKRSNDIFFYRVGERLGINKLAAWAKFFEIDKLSGIDLPSESQGRMPDPEWKQDFKGEAWFLGDTYITAIGQGDILMTPLAVNQMTQVIANQGKLCKPRVLVDQEPVCEDLKIEAEHLGLVKEGMKQACEEGGTGWPFFGFSPQVACKTGTAEVSEDKLPHAWFTLFVPVEDPEIVLTVLLEEAGEGSYEAAPVAKEVLEHWFSQPKPITFKDSP